MSDTPIPTSTLTDTPLSFPEVPSDGLELGNLASSFAHAILGPFEVHEVIGRGGMGIVFSGVHLGQRVPVAIKVITRQGAEQPRLRQVMHNEVRAVAGLDHPGIVRVLDFGDISDAAEVATEGALRAGSPYFVMEMMAHSSLVEIVGRVSWRQAKTILLNLLDALAHSHARDVIHRDIKPGNILLDQWGGRVVPKLADFGLAFATRTPTDVSRSIGTPQYMAPEQIETPWRKHGPWSDLYSVGCLAFELLSGRKLFHGTSILEIFRMHLDGVRKPLRSIVRVPDGFHGWLLRMIERNVQDRYRSAADAARALAALDDSEIPDVRPPDCTPHDFAPLTPVLALNTKSDPDRFDWPKRFPVSMHLVGAGLGLFGLRQIPLVGRRTELEALWSAFREVRNHRPQIVIIRGAHGTGKTKLVDAFAQRLTETGAAVSMRATHTSAGSSEDGAPMMIARWIRAAGATRAEAGGIVRGAMSPDSHQRYEWESVLTLIEPTLAGGAGSAKYAFEFASNEQRHDVVIRQMRRASEQVPVVTIFDDVHFGVDSLDLVTRLKKESDDLPSLVLLTVCDEELAACPEAAELLEALEALPDVQSLELGPLERVDHLNLVHDLLMLSGELASGVADRTHGNPGFAVSLIDEWIGNGDLEVGETGFVLASGADLLTGVPASARDLWRGTLERLFSEYAENDIVSLEIAAALGAVVWTDEWAEVCHAVGVQPCWSAVGDLVDRRLATMTAAGWRFEHPIVGEMLRDSAERAGRWRQWKAACATCLERSDALDTPENLVRLGEYWLGAAEYQQAFQPLEAAANAKLVRGGYREVERVATGMVRALNGAGGDDHALASVYLLRTRIYAGAGRPDEALRWARQALELAEPQGWSDIIAKATGYAALAKQWLGEPDAGECLDRALAMIDEVDDSFRPDGVLMVLGYLLTSLGRFADASRVLQVDRQLAIAAGDDRAIASNAYQRCRTAVYMRDLEEAQACGEEARTRYEAMGHVPALASTLAILAEVHRRRAELDDAVQLYRESIELGQSVGQKVFVSQASLGVVLLEQGQYAEAEEIFLDAANEATATGRRRTEVACRAGLLVCAVKQGHWSSAERLLPAIEEFVATTQETEPDLAELLETAGDGYAEAGRSPNATVLWTMAQKQWETLDATDRAAQVAQKLDSAGGAS